jgi:protein TonB
MDRPLPPTALARPRHIPVALACGLHAAFAVSILILSGTRPPAEADLATAVELVAWSAPPTPAPAPAPTPAATADVAPRPAAKPAATAAPAAERRRPAVAAPRPAAVASPAVDSPAVDSSGVADSPAASPGEPAAADTANAASGTAAGKPDTAAGEPYTPPDGKAAYLANPRPAYPALAQRRGWEGTVTLLVAVNAAGTPQDVTVKQSSGYAVLDRCAMEAVQRWRFTPARRGGQTVAATVEVPVRFDLQEQATG